MVERIVTNTRDRDYNQSSLKTLQILQTWFSSSFPIGSYSYSHGIEAMINDKIILRSNDVLDFIEGSIFHGTCKNDFILIKLTYEGFDLNDFSLALSASKERKLETQYMGNAFRKVLGESWGFELPKDTSFPIGIAKAGINFNIPLYQLSLFYMQSFVSNLINICVKHIPLGQKTGQDCILKSMTMIEKFMEKANDYTIEDIGSVTYFSDLYSIKHENLITRVYST